MRNYYYYCVLTLFLMNWIKIQMFCTKWKPLSHNSTAHPILYILYYACEFHRTVPFRHYIIHNWLMTILRHLKNNKWFKCFFWTWEHLSSEQGHCAKLYSLFDDSRQLSEITITLNANIIKFVLTNIKTDLNELAIKDITYFKRVIREWRRFDGKEIAQSTKSQYFLGLKRFLSWYEETVDYNCGYIKLSKQIKVQMPKYNKLPGDL